MNRLIAALEKTSSRPHLLFSSSTQEERDNVFGKSKREGRKMLEEWAERSGSIFTGMVIPNVFGPFGRPYYNSVVATFSHQLTHNEQPEIDVDAHLKLIYIGDLVRLFIILLENKIADNEFKITPTDEASVTEILTLLQSFKVQYFEQGIIRPFDPFERNLFNTFVCYIDHRNYFPLG